MFQDLVPALIESIKNAGLVLITDISDSETTDNNLMVARPRGESVPNGVDGYLKGNGVLRFNESIDM
jgi:CDK inhibitor PHO81